MIFTANDMREKLIKRNLCQGIDHWIENILYARFVHYQDKAPVHICELEEKSWDFACFEREIKSRGFFIQFIIKDVANSYYEISLPPQGR